MGKPPAALVTAFRATMDSNLEQVVTLAVDDGLEVEAMRVLGAFEHVAHDWEAPGRECPDGGVLPTAAAWRWLVDGMKYDVGELAAAAGVTPATARAKVAMLLGVKLVMPDGSITKPARAAMQAAARTALGMKATKKRDDKKDGGQN